MPLHIVSKAPPGPKQAVVERVKKMPNPDGVWQCNRCGCRTVLATENGVTTQNGRKRLGTVIDKDVCAECWRKGIRSQMVTEIKRVT